jgi:hypothetical protein
LSVAVPELRVPVPIEEPPLKNVMVPVAADGETVAVNVMAVPTTGVLVEGESVTELEVVPVELEGACQKLPQPVVHIAAANRIGIRAVLLQRGMSFTLGPFCCAGWEARLAACSR